MSIARGVRLLAQGLARMSGASNPPGHDDKRATPEEAARDRDEMSPGVCRVIGEPVSMPGQAEPLPRSELRRCAWTACGAILVPKPREEARTFAHRQTCGVRCAGQWSRTWSTCPACLKRLRDPEHRCPGPPATVETPSFPGAAAATYAQAPTQCDRCGGVWRVVADGLACYLCPRTVVIVEALLRRYVPI